MKLSTEQQRVLDYLREHGGVLIRLAGGFWTTPDTKTMRSVGTVVPEWYTTIQTVRAMERKGLLVRVMKHDEWRDERVLT